MLSSERFVSCIAYCLMHCMLCVTHNMCVALHFFLTCMLCVALQVIGIYIILSQQVVVAQYTQFAIGEYISLSGTETIYRDFTDSLLSSFSYDYCLPHLPVHIRDRD